MNQNVLIKDSIFEDVYSMNKGGVLYVDGPGNVIFENTSVTNCSAKCGGAVYIKGGVCYW